VVEESNGHAAAGSSRVVKIVVQLVCYQMFSGVV